MSLYTDYYRCINGGKSENNEDNAYACCLQLKSDATPTHSKLASQAGKNNGSGNNSKQRDGIFERSMVEVASHGMVNYLKYLVHVCIYTF